MLDVIQTALQRFYIKLVGHKGTDEQIFAIETEDFFYFTSCNVSLDFYSKLGLHYF